MRVVEITDKYIWEEFILNSKYTPYIQNWNAGEMYERLGNKIFRLGIFDKDNLVGITLVVKEDSKRGSYLFLPYGPILTVWNDVSFTVLIERLKDLARELRCVFIKTAPFIDSKDENKAIFQKTGFIDSPLHILAETTWILDLENDEDELMKNMRKTTRNLIRRGIKDGVEIRRETTMDAMQRFLELHKQTVSYHQFVPYNNEFFYEHLRSFVGDNQVLILEAWHKGVLLASSIIMYYGKTASYRHGASLHSKIPATYLLQWEAIQEAKNRGMKYYNFWGIYDGENKKHPFYGISFFKKGFGGHNKQLLHCQDLPLKWSYWLRFYAIDTYRKYKRGFGSDKH